MRPATETEKLGIPSVVITATGFSTLGRLTGKAAGVENMRMAEYPGALGIDDHTQIAKNVKEVLLNNIIDGLTKAADEKAVAAAKCEWNPHEIVFAGSLAQVNQVFAHRGWTDGLPIIPPTLERVEEFLKYTTLAPDEKVTILPPSNLMAVPWNIAVNAVMAGCEPQHMPIMMAAVEALGDPRFNIDNVRSTSGLLPFVLINGPIIQQLGIECAGQLISRGPNPAIGRAIGLIVKNIAGVSSGKNYMGTFGYPLVFTLAENEQQSPWESFHVEQGFNKNVSTVTLGMTNNWGAQPAAASTADKSGAQSALEVLSKEIGKKVRLYAYPGKGPHAEIVMITLLISPVVAKSLAQAGYSKNDVKNYLYETTKISLGEFEWITKYTTGKGEGTVREKANAGIFPAEYLGQPQDMVRLLSGPDILHIVVCGDPNRNRMMVLEGGHARPTTKEIRVPANWGELLRQRNETLLFD